MLESRDTETDTIKSWTCKFSDAGKGQTIAKFMSNDDFDTLCTESVSLIHHSRHFMDSNNFYRDLLFML